MGATGRRVIDVKSNAIQKERLAASASIYPGHCLKIDSNGKVDHQGDGAQDAVRVATVNSLEGDGVSDAYASGDTVFYKTFGPGDEVLVRVKNGENIAKGDRMTFAASGEVREVVADSSGTVAEDAVVLLALEACDMSTSSSADADGFCWAEVIR